MLLTGEGEYMSLSQVIHLRALYPDGAEKHVATWSTLTWLTKAILFYPDEQKYNWYTMK